ncbi:MAG TPA: hypothetical protein VGS12_13115 [Caulobacteraceae bacterium]|nr:hypothetical protein [Caulobacteraceae bacterium]
METPAVIGLRAHTGWAAAVAVAGEREAPRVVERRRIELAGAGLNRFVFHHAAELSAADAERWIERARLAAERHATDQMAALVAAIRSLGQRAIAAVVPAAAPLPPLGAIVGAHAKIHAAEGVFWREVTAAACIGVGLEVRRVGERAARDLLAALLPDGRPSLEARLRGLGAALGPPWAEDQKLATVLAWTRLSHEAAALSVSSE